jgi:membrane protease subunit (stomatin/prohibitin family)
MKLDLAVYSVPLKKFEKSKVPGHETENVLVDFDQEINPAVELYNILRCQGVFQSLTDTVDAILLAKKIEESKDEVEVNDKELKLITKAIDVLLLKASKSEINFGGPIMEPLFLRIAKVGK